MEWIRKMKLKRALFIMTFISLGTAALFSALASWGCLQIREQIAPRGVTIRIESGELLVDSGAAAPEDAAIALTAYVFDALQIILPIALFIAAVSVTAA